MRERALIENTRRWAKKLGFESCCPEPQARASVIVGPSGTRAYPFRAVPAEADLTHGDPSSSCALEKNRRGACVMRIGVSERYGIIF